MKTLKILVGIIVVSISAVLIGCPANEKIDEEDEDCCDQPIFPVIFIKFSHPEYKEYVAGQISGTDVDVLTYLSNASLEKVAQVQAKTVGPYIELPDDYLIIGPRCEGLARYRGQGVVIVDMKWKDYYTTSFGKFSADRILDKDNPLREMWAAYADSLRKFNGGVLEHSDGRYNIRSTPEAYTEYTEILTRIVEQGKIERYCEQWK
jgi:hypothetical protein